MQDFRKLRIWQKGHEIVLEIYTMTMKFPKTETYGLVSQMRRSAASIPTNIAEGCGRNGNKELARFVQIAMGSASELEYQILLSHDLGYITSEQYDLVMDRMILLKKMIIKFLTGLRKRIN